MADEHIYTIDDLRILLKDDPDINFFGIAARPSHATEIDAAAHYLSDQGVAVKGIVYLLTDDLSEDNFHLDGLSIRIVHGSLQQKTSFLEKWKYKAYSYIRPFRRINPNKRTVYLVHHMFTAWLMLAVDEQGCHSVWMLGDDGTGSYIVSDNAKDFFAYRKGLLPAGKVLTRPWRIFFEWFMSELTFSAQRKCKKAGRFIDFRLFQKTDKGLEKNPKAFPYYLEEYRRNIPAGYELDKEQFRGTCILVTDNFQYDGLADDNADYELYKQVTDIFHANGKKLVIKPHPHEEDLERYKVLDFPVLLQSISQEALLANLREDERPKYILGIFSSAMTNAYRIFGVPVICLAKIYLTKIDNTFLTDLLERFIKDNQDIFYFPETLDELSIFFGKSAC